MSRYMWGDEVLAAPRDDQWDAVYAHYPDGYRLVVLMGEGEVPPPDVMERNRRQAGQDHAR